MDLETLQRTFPVVEKPGLDTLDPRWDEITTAVQAGEFIAAAKASEALLLEDVCDIRLASYLAFGLFIEQGMPGLAPTLAGLAHLIGEQWESVGPAAGKPKAAQVALGWYFKQLLRKLQREEEVKGETWQQWLAQMDPEGVEAATTALQACVRSIGAALEDAATPVLDPAGKAREWLQAFQRIVYKEPEAPAPEAEPPPEAPQPTAPPLPGAGLAVPGSYHLEVLRRKMAAFERLIAEEKYPRACIVADDIHAIIGAFDPVLYFPALFRGFLKLLALHMGDLAQFNEARETPDWKALQELYKADLDDFVGL
jgi:hypothetical protein